MSSDGPAATRWPHVALFATMGIVAAFQIGKVPPALAALRAEFDLSLVAAGWAISIFNLLGLGFGVALGGLAGMAGERRALLAGLWLTAAASGLGALAPDGATLIASRFVEGIGFLVVTIVAPAFLLRVTAPPQLKLVFGIWGTYNPTGFALMTVMAPYLIASLGWRGLWAASGAALAVLALAVAAATRSDRAPPRAGRDAGGLIADVAATLRTPGPVLLAAAFAAYTFQYMGLMGFLPTILAELGAGPGMAAALTALAVIANALGNLWGGTLLHRGAPRWKLIAGASATMALCSLGIYDASAPFALRYGLCVAFSAVGGWLPTSVLGGAAVYAPERPLVPAATGLVVQGSNVGQTIGPPAVAALAAATGGWHWSPALFLAAGALGVGFALALRAYGRERA